MNFNFFKKKEIELEDLSEKTEFHIDQKPAFIKIPKLTNSKEIDIRYPLIPPYAYAHIFWNEKTSEIEYEVEEPKLDDNETEILKLIKKALEEMINASFIKLAKSNLIIAYLEKNIKNILEELGTQVSRQTYNKLMYFIYRDAVGMNKIEPLLNDNYVEDIECNGSRTPLYIVHRMYENIQTNVIFNSDEELMNFVEKIAQKSGRYVSYAKPLLDGTLPDGSRVNATYTQDVTTRGPTFTIRKFSKTPWSPISLIISGSCDAATYAYLWLAVEHKFNFMIIGETASGKTTFLNSVVAFIPPEARVCSIEDTRELNLLHENWLPAVSRLGFGATNMMGITEGEVSLFDLLKSSFRQSPDYVIVGEVRGKEAYVLFQGMASGHPSFGTFHAGSVETLVRRLENEPINLPSSLIETLDIVCFCAHIKGREDNFRRLVFVSELEKINSHDDEILYNEYIKWDPANDKHDFKENSLILQKIQDRSGIPVDKLKAELAMRTKLLQKLTDEKMTDFVKFNQIVKIYYKNPEQIIKEYNLR